MFKLNEGQKYIINEAVKWFYNSYEQVFQYDGPPGSGKSVVLMEIIKRFAVKNKKEYWKIIKNLIFFNTTFLNIISYS